MDRSEIENQIDRLGLLANDDLLWPVTLLWPVAGAQEWEERIKTLRRTARNQQAKRLHRRAGQLWQRLDEYATNSSFSEGRAIAKFLKAPTERRVEKIFYEHPYLRMDSAVRRMEKMALRAQEVELPVEQRLSLELVCWQRAAKAGLLKEVDPEEMIALRKVRTRASGLRANKEESRLLDFLKALEHLSMQRGHSDPRAVEPLLTAGRHGRALADNKSTPEMQMLQAAILKNLGAVEIGARQSHERAESILREAISRLRSPIEENVPESRETLVDALLCLGISLTGQRRHRQAEKIYRSAARNCTILLKERGDPKYRRVLAKTFEDIGSRAYDQGNHEQSEQANLAAVVHYHVLFLERKATLADRKRLAQSLRSVGTANLHHLGRYEKAEKFLRASAGHFRSLYKNLNRLEKKLADVLRNLGEACLRQRKNKHAEESFEGAIVHCRAFFEKHNTLESIESLALANTYCGLAKLREQKFQSAEENFSAAANHARFLRRAEFEGASLLVASALYYIGSIKIKQEEIRAAEENLQTAVDQTETFSTKASSYQDLDFRDPIRQGRGYYKLSRWGGLYGLAFCQVLRSEESSCSSREYLLEAQSYLKRALQEIRSERRKLGTFEERTALREEWDHIYEYRREVARLLGNTDNFLRWTSGFKGQALTELIDTSISDG